VPLTLGLVVLTQVQIAYERVVDLGDVVGQAGIEESAATVVGLSLNEGMFTDELKTGF